MFVYLLDGTFYQFRGLKLHRIVSASIDLSPKFLKLLLLKVVLDEVGFLRLSGIPWQSFLRIVDGAEGGDDECLHIILVVEVERAVSLLVIILVGQLAMLDVLLHHQGIVDV